MLLQQAYILFYIRQERRDSGGHTPDETIAVAGTQPSVRPDVVAAVVQAEQRRLQAVQAAAAAAASTSTGQPPPRSSKGAGTAVVVPEEQERQAEPSRDEHEEAGPGPGSAAVAIAAAAAIKVHKVKKQKAVVTARQESPPVDSRELPACSAKKALLGKREPEAHPVAKSSTGSIKRGLAAGLTTLFQAWNSLSGGILSKGDTIVEGGDRLRKDVEAGEALVKKWRVKQNKHDM